MLLSLKKRPNIICNKFWHQTLFFPFLQTPFPFFKYPFFLKNAKILEKKKNTKKTFWPSTSLSINFTDFTNSRLDRHALWFSSLSRTKIDQVDFQSLDIFQAFSFFHRVVFLNHIEGGFGFLHRSRRPYLTPFFTIFSPFPFLTSTHNPVTILDVQTLKGSPFHFLKILHGLSAHSMQHTTFAPKLISSVRYPF